MKLLVLANPEDPHTIKWVNELAREKIEIFVLGLNQYDSSIYDGLVNVQHQSVGFANNYINSRLGNFSKILYLKSLPLINKIIKEFQPDIIHAHYASSYGLLTSFLSFTPVVLSVWGSDVYKFPRKSLLHKHLIKRALRKTRVILSTSNNMAGEIRKYTDKAITVIPFGIDTQKFTPVKKRSGKEKLVIGTIKKLKKYYGIDILIQAFKLVLERNPDFKLELKIIGEGPERKKLENMTDKFGIRHLVYFEGKMPPDRIPEMINQMDIFSSLSVYDESFGVALLEAGACEKPVVVSNVPGFIEIVQNGATGFIVKKGDIEGAAKAIEELIKSKELRHKMGSKARKHVVHNYSLEHNVEQLLEVYNKLLRQS